MSAITIPSPTDVQTASPARRLLSVLPGMALLFGIGLLGKLLEQAQTLLHARYPQIAVPHIEYVLWAIVLGLIIGNTIGVRDVFRSGVATYELWLKLGIVLVGGKFLLQDVLQDGAGEVHQAGRIDPSRRGRVPPVPKK